MVDDGRCLAPRQKPNFTPQSQQLHYKRLSICSFKDFSRRHRDLHIIQRPSFRRSFPDRRSSLDTSVERTTNRLNQRVLYFDWPTAENYVMDWSYMEKILDKPGTFFSAWEKRWHRSCNQDIENVLNRIIFNISQSLCPPFKLQKDFFFIKIFIFRFLISMFWLSLNFIFLIFSGRFDELCNFVFVYWW